MKRLRPVIAIVLLTFFGSSVAALAAGPQSDIVFILSKDQAATRVDEALLRNIYLGKASFWPDGSPINAYGRPLDSPAGLSFLKLVARMTPVRFKHHWAGLKLSGQAMDIAVVGDTHQLGARVAANKGSIGYLLTSEAQGLDKNQVRVVTLAL